MRVKVVLILILVVFVLFSCSFQRKEEVPSGGRIRIDIDLGETKEREERIRRVYVKMEKDKVVKEAEVYLQGESREGTALVELLSDKVVGANVLMSLKRGELGIKVDWNRFLSEKGYVYAEWEEVYGGSKEDVGYSIIKTYDENYVIAGYTGSNDWEITKLMGAKDGWVIKISSEGKLLWQRTFGGSSWERFYSIKETKDRGFIVVGYTRSKDGDVIKNRGGADAWVVKLNKYGELQWQRTYGGSRDEEAYDILQSMDGGYIFVGYSKSKDGDLKENKGNEDIWVVKIDRNGMIKWQRTFGGSFDDIAYSVFETKDGKILVTGYSRSKDGDIPKNRGKEDAFLMCLNSKGELEWIKTYGGSSTDVGKKVMETSDGGILLVGYTDSNDGDITEAMGREDFWVIKLDKSTRKVWERNLGGSNSDVPYTAIETSEGKYLIGGYTRSYDGHVKGNNGARDAWLVLLDEEGYLVWQMNFGGSAGDCALSLENGVDKGYIFVGYSRSDDGDVESNRGSYDIWVVKFNVE